MIKKLLLPLLIVTALAACNKDKYTVEYIVKCNECEISYWDENSEYIARIPSTGTWSYSFEAIQANKISVAGQSTFFLDSATTCYNFNCADTISDTLLCWDLACANSLRPTLYAKMLADSVYVTIKIDGKVEKTASEGNRPFAAAWAEVFIE